MQYFRYLLCSIITIVILSSCAAPSLYYKNLDTMVKEGKYKEAASLTQNSREKEYGEKNNLLYYFDYGMFQHLSGNYEESNNEFNKAKKLSDEYFTKSITTEASTFVVNDTIRPYYGEDFERAQLYIFSALNYCLLNKESDALVEARQVDHFLNTLQTNYGYKNVYKEDPFARYITGMLFENQGEINDAFISYRQALESYEMYQNSYSVTPPNKLIGDVIRTARKLGLKDEVSEIEKKWKISKEYFTEINPAEGELVILHLNGIAPVKAEDFFEISFGKGWAYVGQVTVKDDDAGKAKEANAIARSILADEQIRIAFPKYVPSEYQIKKSKIIDANLNKEYEQEELVQDIGKLAITNLNDRLTRIRIKSIARAAVRYALAKKLEKKIVDNQRGSDKALVGFIAKAALNTLSTTIEHADTRSWRSLPDKIYMERITLPEGVHSLKMLCFNQDNSLVTTKSLENIKIKPGKKTFLIVRTAE